MNTDAQNRFSAPMRTRTFFGGIFSFCVCAVTSIAESAPMRGLSDGQGWALVEAVPPKAVFLTWFCSYGPHKREHTHVETQAQTVQWTISRCHHIAGHTIGHIIGHIIGCYHQKHHWMHLSPSGYRQKCLAQTPELDPSASVAITCIQKPTQASRFRATWDAFPTRWWGARQLVPSLHIMWKVQKGNFPILCLYANNVCDCKAYSSGGGASRHSYAYVVFSACD